jgi:hypothetical protein
MVTDPKHDAMIFDAIKSGQASPAQVVAEELDIANKMIAEDRQLIDRLQAELAVLREHARKSVCSYCRLVIDHNSTDDKFIDGKIAEHIQTCPKRPELKLTNMLQATAHGMTRLVDRILADVPRWESKGRMPGWPFKGISDQIVETLQDIANEITALTPEPPPTEPRLFLCPECGAPLRAVSDGRLDCDNAHSWTRL